jgi:hypothetical protein
MSETTMDFPMGEGNNIHVVIYVPSTENIYHKISNARFQRRVRDTVRFLRSTLQGSTRIAGVGNYYSEAINRPVTEKIAKIESFTKKEEYNKYDKLIQKWLEKRKKDWKQESLSYEYNESLFFI